MHCPTCLTTPLVIADRQGVEVDYCPHCRGVWLDRGELDKLLDRAARAASAQARQGAAPGHADALRGAAGQRRRKSWLSDILD